MTNTPRKNTIVEWGGLRWWCVSTTPAIILERITGVGSSQLRHIVRLEPGEFSDSAFRDSFHVWCAAVPWWKRALICWVLKRKQWKLARAHNLVACSMLLSDRHEIGEAVRAAGDLLWAEIFEIPNAQPSATPEDAL